MDIGPIELVVLAFPTERADPKVIDAIVEVVERGYVTVLDILHLARTTDGHIRVTDVDQDLSEVGLGKLQVEARALVSEDDMELVREALEPGTSAAILVYEQTWARKVAGAIEDAGGRVELHIQVPRETIVAAIAAAAEE